jgi:nicotinamide-nucleotide amidase
LSRPQAAIVVTGSELVRGDRQDRNGPFLAAEVVRLGLDPTRIAIIGDRVDDLERAFAEGFTADLCLVSGGLGPTHDDRTVELVARVAGRSLVLDEALECEIGAISRLIAERLGRSHAEFTPGVRKQATLPEGAISLGLAGTAPGVVLDTGSCVVVVLPGPPRELQRLWPRALETEPVRRVLARAPGRAHHVLRFFGTPESAVAEALAAAGGEGDGVDVTICAREFEIHVDLFVEPSAEERGFEVATSLREALAPYLFGEDGQSISEIVLGLCHSRGLTLATAESCTGGMVASRLTGVAGSSEVFLGSVVAYANGVKEAGLGVPAELIAEHGAVSAEVAAAMATGARERLGADVAVAVTGVAGPGGGTAEKPVGLVFAHAVGPDGEKSVRTELPGDRDMIRGRATAASLHLVRRLLESRHTSP